MLFYVKRTGGKILQSLSKKLLIQTAYNMIWEYGFEEVSIRKIADNVGASSAALYRHFDNLDHLLTYACIGFLEPYIGEFKMIKQSTANSFEISSQMWIALARTSFFNPRIFAHLFLGQYRNQVYLIIDDYYNIMGKEIFNLADTSSNMKQLGELLFRNYDYIKNSNANYSIETIAIISDLILYSYSGMIATLLNKEYRVAEIEDMIDRFTHSVRYALKNNKTEHQHF